MAPPKAPAPAAGAAWAPDQAALRTVQLTITCPNCKTPFAATRGPAPTRIKCPSCGTEGTLPPLPQQPAPAAAPAGAPQPGAMPEVKMPLDCPKCGTHFEVTRGYTPTRIKCPSCGTEGTLPPLARPAMPAVAPAPAVTPAPAPPAAGHPVPAPTTPVTAARADMAVAPVAPSAVQYKTISCPRCKRTFTIEKKEGPQQIKCPHCGKEGAIGKPAAAAAMAPAPVATPPAAPPAPKLPPAVPLSAIPPPRHPAPGRMITCPQCHVPFPVSDTRRPLSVRCPNCGKEGVLRK